MRAWVLLSLLLIAAQTVIVDVEILSEEQAQIQQYEFSNGLDPTRNSGEWLLQLRSEDLVVSETQFHPYSYSLLGEKELISELSVPALAPAGVTQIRILTPTGSIAATQQISGFCGDLLCEESERTTCAKDCSQEIVAATTQEPSFEQTTSTQESSVRDFILLGLILMVLILAGIFIHINKARKNKPAV